MEKNFLADAYSIENFKDRGHKLIDQLADHLEEKLHGKSEKTIAWSLPEDEKEFWSVFLNEGDPNKLFQTILERTTHVHSPKCMGHQVTPTVPITALTAMISALLNNGMAVYEMGMSPTAMERIVTDLLCEKIGYNARSRGFLTSGGTLANLTALLSARKAKITADVWNNGHGKPLGIMVSEEAHYCIDRAAKIMGLGERGIIKIPSRPDFSINTSLLEERYTMAIENGIQVFAIVGSAPSTATGAFDDLSAIAEFAKKYQLWLHVDGAHGGAAIFSAKYKHVIKGIEQADSVVIDGHKMMMMPTITTALLFKDGNDSYATFSQKADYLLVQSEDEDWYNLAKRTLECTKTMMSIHWYTLLKVYGERIFDEYLTNQFDVGLVFAALIEEDPNFELAVKPMANIVCFRFVTNGLDDTALNILNAKVRTQLLEDGEFYVVQTKLRGVYYLRTTFMNPFTTKSHMKMVLHKVKQFVGNSKIANS
ncbi:MAG: pyridoxal-dependent decarboxylase [Pricia sp.]|nr:pyridoxal-dependent decarboxylase [Pricia sp.]